MRSGRVIPFPQDEQQLDPLHLDVLERSFRDWAKETDRRSTQASRNRILLIFLLIRYTGAKLSEVLSLRPSTDIDPSRNSVTFGCQATLSGQGRMVQISTSLSEEIAGLLATIRDTGDPERLFAVDPAFVRRKFYERARACGLAKEQGGPEMIRKARAVELMRNNLPLPVVQHLLGHSTPNLTTAFMAFSDEEMSKVTRWYMEREAGRKTSARNSFFGKISSITRDNVQTLVEMTTPGGHTVSTMITNASAERLDVRPGSLITAEIKATWLILEHCDRPGDSSAENRLTGEIVKVVSGKINTECTVRLADGTELCAVLSSDGFAALALTMGNPVRVLFNCYAVVLHTD